MGESKVRNVLLISDVSERYRIKEATLRWYRSVGRGPKSFKIGRRIAYFEDDCEAWLKEQYDRDNPAA